MLKLRAAWILAFFLPMCECVSFFNHTKALLRLVTGTGDEGVHSERRLRLIGATLPRTGTLSTKSALMKLGFRTYHTIDIIHRRHAAYFNHFFDTGDASQAITAIREAGFDATVDTPSCWLFKEFMDHYPEAKVLLTVRDSPEAWAKSLRESIGGRDGDPIAYFGKPPFAWLPALKAISEMGKKQLQHGKVQLEKYEKYEGKLNETDDMLAKIYAFWVAHVKANVPPEKLLVFSVKDGYGPLCKFLGIRVEDNPVCADPFPHINDKAMMKRTVFILWVVTEYYLILFCVFVIFLLLVIRRCCRCCASSTQSASDVVKKTQ